jgi:biotin synthase
MTLSIETVREIYHRPLLGLIGEAHQVTLAHHAAHEVQLCTLMSIKTGGCPEDCKYCSQSIFNKTDLEKETLLSVDTVLTAAKSAKENGSTRFCMGAAWRDVKDGRGFDRVLDMVRGVRDLDLEVCCTLGMVTEEQAVRLKQAGLTAYNHNLDTSEQHYDKVITTRTYQDRLETIAAVSKAGISVCCGGILGMGENEEDRIALLHRLAALDPQPESVPINMLVKVDGTPLADVEELDIFEWVRCIAVARLIMPKAMVRLSAGRLSISREAQALAFMAGANAIFTGEKLLTTANPGQDHDLELLAALGLKPRPAFKCAS